MAETKAYNPEDDKIAENRMTGEGGPDPIDADVIPKAEADKNQESTENVARLETAKNYISKAEKIKDNPEDIEKINDEIKNDPEMKQLLEANGFDLKDFQANIANENKSNSTKVEGTDKKTESGQNEAKSEISKEAAIGVSPELKKQLTEAAKEIINEKILHLNILLGLINGVGSWLNLREAADLKNKLDGFTSRSEKAKDIDDLTTILRELKTHVDTTLQGQVIKNRHAADGFFGRNLPQRYADQFTRFGLLKNELKVAESDLITKKVKIDSSATS